MKRILTLAIAVAATGFFGVTSNASAADHFHGRHHNRYAGHGQTGHQYLRNRNLVYRQGFYGGYASGTVQSFAPNYGYRGRSYGAAPGYGSGYGSGYTPSNHGSRGGVHLDIGRFHVLGLGGHH